MLLPEDGRGVSTRQQNHHAEHKDKLCQSGECPPRVMSGSHSVKEKRTLISENMLNEVLVVKIDGLQM